MPYAPFYERFPDIAKQETRTLSVLNHPVLPKGDYGLLEAYCNEPDCDCRRVFFNVMDWQTGQVMAVITYGWENKEFYAQWMKDNDPRILKELKGPSLNLGSYQSSFAAEFLKQMTDILVDSNYVDRLKQHYKMYRAAIDEETGHQQSWKPKLAFPGGLTTAEATQKVHKLNKIKNNKHKNQLAKKSRKQNRHRH